MSIQSKEKASVEQKVASRRMEKRERTEKNDVSVETMKKTMSLFLVQ